MVKFFDSFQKEKLFGKKNLYCIVNSAYSLILQESVGFGAIWNTHWCFAPWPAEWVSRGFCNNIVLLELFPLIVVIEIWGEQFANKRILVSTDNKGVLFAVNCLSSKSQPVISPLPYMVYKCLCLNIWVKAKYIPGKENTAADALSCSQME